MGDKKQIEEKDERIEKLRKELRGNGDQYRLCSKRFFEIMYEIERLKKGIENGRQKTNRLAY